MPTALDMRLSLRGKLLALAGIILAMTLVLGIASITSLSVGSKGASMYGDRVVPLRDLGEVRGILGDLDSQTLRSLAAVTQRPRSRRRTVIAIRSTSSCEATARPIWWAPSGRR